jgi:hypothetical protein
MANYADVDHDFSDDDFNDLPTDALAELENNAIQFTQSVIPQPQAYVQAQVQAQPKPGAVPSSDYGDDFDDDDLDDAVVIDESRSTPAALASHIQNGTGPAVRKDAYQPKFGNGLPLGNDSFLGNNSSLKILQRANVPFFHRHSGAPSGSIPSTNIDAMPVRPGSQQVPLVNGAADLMRELEEVCRKPNVMALCSLLLVTQEKPSLGAESQC